MRKGNTKERLIMAALDLFSVKGYDGTTVEDIAKHVGIKAPTLYKYFRGKEELMQQLGERFDGEYLRGMEQNMAGAEKIRSGRDLTDFSMGIIQFTMSDEMVVKVRRMVNIEQYRSEIFTERATRYQITRICSIYAVVFKMMMDQGTMIQGDPYVFALEYTAPVTVMIQMSDRQPDRREEALAAIARHFEAFNERYCTVQ